MSAQRTLRIGTRGSALALWQAQHIAALLGAAPDSRTTEIVTIATTGDIVVDVPLWQVEGKAFFTKELDEALLDGRIDLAVHSLKDVATELPSGISLAAVPEREDPRDALVTARGAKSLAELPRGARIATSSVRRRAFVRHARADFETVELRGNVPTRVRQLDEGRFEAIIVAVAGLNRLGLASRISAYLDPAEFPPAAAQGALGVCARTDDVEVLAALDPLNHLPSRTATTAERSFLRQLEAGCQVPAGVLATVRADRVSMQAAMCEPDGTGWTRARIGAGISEAESAGRALAIALAAGEKRA
ncbi:MAG: hydroxymethylbilane synthase [Gammaproteobacteria bacterium]